MWQSKVTYTPRLKDRIWASGMSETCKECFGRKWNPDFYNIFYAFQSKITKVVKTTFYSIVKWLNCMSSGIFFIFCLINHHWRSILSWKRTSWKHTDKQPVIVYCWLIFYLGSPSMKCSGITWSECNIRDPAVMDFWDVPLNIWKLPIFGWIPSPSSHFRDIGLSELFYIDFLAAEQANNPFRRSQNKTRLFHVLVLEECRPFTFESSGLTESYMGSSITSISRTVSICQIPFLRPPVHIFSFFPFYVQYLIFPIEQSYCKYSFAIVIPDSSILRTFYILFQVLVVLVQWINHIRFQPCLSIACHYSKHCYCPLLKALLLSGGLNASTIILTRTVRGAFLPFIGLFGHFVYSEPLCPTSHVYWDTSTLLYGLKKRLLRMFWWFESSNMHKFLLSRYTYFSWTYTLRRSMCTQTFLLSKLGKKFFWVHRNIAMYGSNVSDHTVFWNGWQTLSKQYISAGDTE